MSGRLAIVGLPGAGKSTALEQLAAQWAGDPDAPLPVVVRLHRLVGPLRDRAALGIDALVAAIGPVVERARAARGR